MFTHSQKPVHLHVINRFHFSGPPFIPFIMPLYDRFEGSYTNVFSFCLFWLSSIPRTCVTCVICFFYCPQQCVFAQYDLKCPKLFGSKLLLNNLSVKQYFFFPPNYLHHRFKMKKVQEIKWVWNRGAYVFRSSFCAFKPPSTYLGHHLRCMRNQINVHYLRLM